MLEIGSLRWRRRDPNRQIGVGARLSTGRYSKQESRAGKGDGVGFGAGGRIVRGGGLLEREPEMEKKGPKQTDWRWGPAQYW
jgi:hypothetical protein